MITTDNPASVALALEAERIRAAASAGTARAERAELGQFLTPEPTARLMAAMFGDARDPLRLLDPGAGSGSLTAAVIAELLARPTTPRSISVTAYEVDEGMLPFLDETLTACAESARRRGCTVTYEIRSCDFIKAGLESGPGLFKVPERYDWAILNPPYGKLAVDSAERRALRAGKLDAPNLYAAFLLLAADLLNPGGELVSITPRSFANGPYFSSFRGHLFRRVTPRRLHLFHARNRAFSEDAVLQENVIVHAVRAPRADGDEVLIGAGVDAEDQLATEHNVPLSLVQPGGPADVLFLPDDAMALELATRMRNFTASLASLGLGVSTGPVVDFRVSDALRIAPEPGSVPLLYPVHLREGRVTWPVTGRKPNALMRSPATARQLVPSGTYVLVKRFTAKEEVRRIVATVVTPDDLDGSELGIENHLNYFHAGGRGLPADIARGLAAYLNSALVDDYFRLFSGHTQVNASDLRMLGYPTLPELRALGQAASDPASIEELTGELRRMVEGVNARAVESRIAEALDVLRQLGMPRQQLNERSALTLLALLGLAPETPWSEARDPLVGITQMMGEFADKYGKRYAPNTRETVRRQTVHQFLDAGLIVQNPDDPDRPTNSAKTVYRIEASALELLRTYGTSQWDTDLAGYQASVGALRDRYAREREMHRIPVQLDEGHVVALSAGGQNILIKLIIEEFGSRFAPGGKVLYVGDADEKWMVYEAEDFAALGVEVEAHGKMPDVVLHDRDRNWLVLVEAVTSHGPVDAKRRAELEVLFAGSTAGLVFVTAFLDRKTMMRYLPEISWETEVWIAESPSHLIHFNGERFLGPYADLEP